MIQSQSYYTAVTVKRKWINSTNSQLFIKTAKIFFFFHFIYFVSNILNHSFHWTKSEQNKNKKINKIKNNNNTIRTQRFHNFVNMHKFMNKIKAAAKMHKTSTQQQMWNRSQKMYSKKGNFLFCFVSFLKIF